MKKVVVSVPATSANLGPGFDCVGIAYTIRSQISFMELPNNEFKFSGVNEEYRNENNLSIQAYYEALKELGIPKCGLYVDMDVTVPYSRGLGSSAILIVAGVVAANVAHGSKLSREKMFEICTKIEGHPDNIAPAIYGGLTVSIVENGIPTTVCYKPHKSLHFVAFIPDFELPTVLARQVLPKNFSIQDAIYNISHCAFLMKAMEMGNSELISIAMDDKLHQPYREHLIDEFDEIKKIAMENGAISFCISGAGPTLLALTKSSEFSKNVLLEIKKLKNDWKVIDMPIDYEGVKVQIEET